VSDERNSSLDRYARGSHTSNEGYWSSLIVKAKSPSSPGNARNARPTVIHRTGSATQPEDDQQGDQRDQAGQEHRHLGIADIEVPPRPAMPVAQIANRLRVSSNAVYVWRRAWRAEGPAGLASRDPAGQPADWMISAWRGWRRRWRKDPPHTDSMSTNAGLWHVSAI
jgi:hypothetical protein